MPGTLILLRHGLSEFNADARFTGLLDVGLTAAGAGQARVAAEQLATVGLVPDTVVVSPLLRATRTAEIVTEQLGIEAHPVVEWRLAERDYGCLTQMAKHEVRTRFGEEAFFAWRRTLDGKPPAAGAEQAAAWTRLPGPEVTRHLRVGGGESLHEVIDRVAPWWNGAAKQLLASGRRVLVVAHGNSLRALCALIDHLDEATVAALNIPPAQPLVYGWADDWAPVPPGGRYLDPAAACAEARVIAAEGGT